MKKQIWVGFTWMIALFSVTPAFALDLDWSGQFWAEANYLKGYSLGTDLVPDPARVGKGGYYIPGGGESSAGFQTLFFRLKPKVIVNDNIYLKSEWWAGNPQLGMFGNAFPFASDQRQFYSNQSRGAEMSVQRLWAEVITDMGVVQVGRAPFHWGLGMVWNSGDKLFDRYQTTGDTIRMISKFGAFTVSPSYIKYSQGNNVGGACMGSPCVVANGSGAVSEASIIFKYENPDEDFEGGLNWVKRLAGAGQDVTYGTLGYNGIQSGMNYQIWDLYGRKKYNKFSFGVEIPITAGEIGGVAYRTVAAAAEATFSPTSTFDGFLKAGYIPGQPADDDGTPTQFKAFYVNPAYRLGKMLFNYQLANFAGPNTANNPLNGGASQRSIYDNPITNALYYSFGGAYKLDKWSFGGEFSFAHAQQTAQAGQFFYNTWERKYYSNASGLTQSAFMGWEMDYQVGLKWDDSIQFGFDFGWFFPGSFYQFSNTTTQNQTDSVFGTALTMGISF